MKIKLFGKHWFKRCSTCNYRLRSGDYYEERSDGTHHRMCVVMNELTWPG